MNGMFWNAKLFNQPLNFTSTENVNNMNYMFYYAESFNQPYFNTECN